MKQAEGAGLRTFAPEGLGRADPQQSDHLQPHPALLGPEPGHGLVAGAAAQQVCGRHTRLVLGVLNGLQAQAGRAQRELRAVAQGQDVRVAGAHVRIDHDALVADQARGLGQFGVGLSAYGQQQQVHIVHTALARQAQQASLAEFGLADRGLQLHLHAVGAVDLQRVRGQRLGHSPAHQPGAGFKHGHRLAQGRAGGRHLQANEAATQDGD